MKSFGIKIFALLVVLFISISSFAEKGQKLTAEQRATVQMQKINEICSLTSEQQVQVKELLENKITTRESIVAGKKSKLKATASSRKENRAAVKAALKNNKMATDEAMKNILTPEQIAQWKAYKQK